MQLFLGGVEARRWDMTDGELITVDKVREEGGGAEREKG